MRSAKLSDVPASALCVIARIKQMIEYVEAVKTSAVILCNMAARAQFRYKKIEHFRLFEQCKTVRRFFAGNDFYKLVAQAFNTHTLDVIER